MAYVTIVRHGQSESNLAGLVESRSEGKLTETGAETARTLGKYIKDEKFTRIYSSDLNRCRETVEHVVSQLETTVPPIKYRADLRERDFGDSELAPAKAVWDTIMKAGVPLHLAHTVEAPHGEPYENARERANNFLQEIFALVDTGTDSSSENILVVTHGVFIRCLLDNILENADLYEVQNADDEQHERVPKNTCRTRFSVGQNKENPNGKRVIRFTHYFDLEHLN